jgi:excisionase family DNA binding protein
MELLQVQVGEEGEPRVAAVPRVLLNETDARVALGDISRSKLYDLVSRGELRAVKLGPGRRAGIRFRIKDLQEFADRHLAK